MAFRKITQHSPLKWFPSDALTYFERFGQKWGAEYLFPTPINQIPPFQFSREQTGSQIVYFRLHNVAAGTFIDITDEIKAAGLRVDECTDGDNNFDLITYPGTVKLLGVTLEQTVYQAIMSDGVNVWRSDCFNMLNDKQLERFVKITWCNNDPIPYDGGKISYANGFKHVIYLDTEIRRPSYPLVTIQNTRQTVNFFSQKMAYKEYTMEVQLPEYILDSLHYISLHSDVEIEHEGVCYTATDWVLGEVEWPDGVGDIGKANPTFRASTLAIKTVGNGTDCEIPEGTCVTVNFNAKDILVVGQALYNAFQYVDKNGDTQSLTAGDYVITSNTGIAGDPLNLEQFNGTGYTSVLAVPDQVVYEETTGRYYFFSGGSLVLPRITSYVDPTVTGVSLPDGTVVEVWARADGVDSLMAVISDAELEAGYDLPTLPSGADFLYLQIGSPTCGNFYMSDLFMVVTLGCVLDLHGQYATEADAVTAGIAAGQEWESDNSFTLGVPEGTVFEYQSDHVYNDQTAAVANGLAAGDCFALALSNPWGLPVNLLVVLEPTVTYDDDAAAGVGGVAIGQEYYLSSNNSYGLGLLPNGGIVKIRKA